MSLQYDEMQGTPMDVANHPATKLAGDVVNFPMSSAASDMRRLTAPIGPDEKQVPAAASYGTNRTTSPRDNVIKLPGVD